MTAACRPPADPLGRSFRLCAQVVLVLVAIPAFWPLGTAVGSPSACHTLAEELPRLILLLRNTALLAVGVLAICLPAGVCLGATLFRVRLPMSALWLVVLVTAAFTPLVLYVGGWQSLIGPYGIVRPSLGPRLSVGGLPAVLAIHSLAALPWVSGIVGLALRAGERDLEEQALLQASPARVLWSVSLPLAWPALLFASFLAIVPILTDMTVTDLFVVRTFAEEVYTELETGGGGQATSLVALAMSLLFALLLALLLGRLANSRLWPTADLPSYQIERGTRWLALAGASLFVCLLLPLVGLIRQLGLETSPTGGDCHWSAWVAWHYLTTEYANAGPTILANAISAGTAGLLSIALAIPLAWYWRFGGRVARSVGPLLLAWLLLLPGPLLGISLIELFDRPSPLGLLGALYDSPAVMLLGQALRALPLALLVLASAFLRLDRQMLDAALVEGAYGWSLLLRVVLPAMRPVGVLAWLISSAFCLSELPTTKLLAPPGSDPLAVRIFGLLHTGTANQQAALCLVLLSMIVVTATASYFVARRLARAEDCAR